MNLLKRLFRRSTQADETWECDFCETVVSEDRDKVGIIKGASALEDFEQRTGIKHTKEASMYDPKDGEKLFFACQTCLMRYEGLCTKFKSPAEELIPVVLQGETSGKRVQTLLCSPCFRQLMDDGAQWGGIV